MYLRCTLPLLATLALAACHDRPEVIQVHDSDAATPKPGQMTVTGTAKLEVSPDCADLTMTITGDGDRPATAAGAVQRTEDALVGKLRAAGVGATDLKLSSMQLDPHYEPDPASRWGTPRLTGYHAEITITATTRDFAALPGLMQAGADAGVTTMSSQFRRSDLDKLKLQLRDMALAAAKAKAQQTARDLGIHVGRVTSVVENAGGMMWNQEYFPQATANVEATRNAGTPLGGTLQPLTLDVTVGYELAVET